MVIVKIFGGLGNQLFQYAIGRALGLKNGVDVKYDVTNFKTGGFRKCELPNFCIDGDLATRKDIRRIQYSRVSLLREISLAIRRKRPHYGKSFILEENFHYSPQVLKIKNDAYLSGYWQSYKYFKKYWDKISAEFNPKNSLCDTALKYKREISTCNAVSLHIRRGDYLTNERVNMFHGLCSIDYYKSAIKVIKDDVLNPCFFVFSDDLEWAIENFSILEGVKFVKLPKATADYEEMFLMSYCKHNIIANSTFSWWGAWLNRNAKKNVIAPSKWFTDPEIDTSDLFPPTWRVL
ncbi:MAG: alpha-1,2-fucosyltransferase [Opitutaceae bacterium]|nr:alpha-1,2-fucosyltransferase [Opitutaceae bacterium]|tara:strand:+ start:819 stop:1694 length:876 start_codon:yes stop_codon:yes gene_type:complete